MRGSSKPCPGCAKVKLGRPAKEVCLDCRRLLGRAEWLENKLAGIAKGKVTVVFARQPGWNEYIYTRSGRGGDLREIFHRLARAAGPSPAINANAEIDNLLGNIEYGGGQYVAMPKPLAVAIKDLWVAVLEALELEYECGKADGHDLLLRLASGDVSTSAFDAIVNK